MALVGDRSSFAIEWEETAVDESRRWVRGHFCFWANGERIGQYEEELSLGDRAYWLRKFLSRAHERQLPALDGQPMEEVFAYIHGLEGAPNPQRDWILDSHLRNVFYLDAVGGDAFLDHIDAILVNDESAGVQRLIWRDRGDWCDGAESRLSEAHLSDHTFDEVARQFLAACVVPIQLWELFEESRWAPITFRGQMVYHKYKRQVRGWTVVKVRRLRHNPAHVQGIRVKSGRVEMEFDGQRTRDLIIWADSQPEECSFRVIGQQGAMLTIWNQYRTPGESKPEGGWGNAGMLVEEQHEGVTLSRCDAMGPPDFQDLVVQIEFARGTAG